jgi:hypothetical protein
MYVHMYVHMYVCHSHASPNEAAPSWRYTRALISGLEGHNLLAKQHEAAKDTGQYNYLKSNSTVYVALAMLV